MQQIDALTNFASLVLAQSGFLLPWAEVLGDVEQFSPKRRFVVSELLQSTACFSHPSKIKRQLAPSYHDLLMNTTTTTSSSSSSSIAAAARVSPELQAITQAMGDRSADSNDTAVHEALLLWDVSTLGFNALSEKLTQYPVDAAPAAAFWLAILAHDDALEDALDKCARSVCVCVRACACVCARV